MNNKRRLLTTILLSALLLSASNIIAQTFLASNTDKDGDVQYVWQIPEDNHLFVFTTYYSGNRDDPRTTEENLNYRSAMISITLGSSDDLKPAPGTTVSLIMLNDLIDKSFDRFEKESPLLIIKSLGVSFKATDESWQDLMNVARDIMKNNESAISYQAFDFCKEIERRYHEMQLTKSLQKTLSKHKYKMNRSSVLLTLEYTMEGKPMKSLLAFNDLGITSNTANITYRLVKTVK